MTSGEIRGNIRYNENLIYQFTNEKKALERKLNELEVLRNKFAVLQKNFEARQDARRRGILRFANLSIQNKIYKAYMEGMQELITGNSFNKAYAGLDEARNKIRRQMQDILNQIDECEANITYRKNRKAYWEWQLQIALEQEAAAALASSSDA